MGPTRILIAGYEVSVFVRQVVLLSNGGSRMGLAIMKSSWNVEELKREVNVNAPGFCK